MLEFGENREAVNLSVVSTNILPFLTAQNHTDLLKYCSYVKIIYNNDLRSLKPHLLLFVLNI